MLEQIAETNVAVVEHAIREGLDFAIKKAKPGENYEKNRKILMLSAEVQQNLNHKNIIKVFKPENGEPIVDAVEMEYFPHPTLAQILAERGKLTFGTGLAIMSQIIDAIEYAHGNNATHGDLSPENVLVDFSDSRLEIKVTDFGYNPEFDAAYVENSVVSGQNSTFVFKPQYLSPEQLNGMLKPSKESDAYAISLMFREMLTGLKPPLAGKLPHQENREITEETKQFFEGGFETVPVKRAKIAELKYLLKRLREGYDIKLNRPIEIIIEEGLNAADAGRRRLEEGELLKAEEAYRAAVSLSPKDPDAIESLIKVCIIKGDINYALDLLESKRDYLRNQKEILFEAVKAGIILGNNRVRRYLRHLEVGQLASLPLGIYTRKEIAMIKKGAPEAIGNNLGIVGVLEGKTERAREHFEKSNTAESFHNLALLNLSIGELREAIKTAAKSIEKNPSGNRSGAIIRAAIRQSGIDSIAGKELFNEPSFSGRVLSKLFSAELLARGVKSEHYIIT